MGSLLSRDLVRKVLPSLSPRSGSRRKRSRQLNANRYSMGDYDAHDVQVLRRIWFHVIRPDLSFFDRTVGNAVAKAPSIGLALGMDG